MSYFPAIIQDVRPDAANSYHSTIAAGATWNSAGVGTSTLGVAGIQVVLAADQNLIIYVDQGHTNASFQITDEYNYNTLIPNFGITIQAVGAFVRVRVKNIGPGVANVILDTVLCPIVEAVPRSLDENQLFKTAIYELNDEYGHRGMFNSAGALAVNQPYKLVGIPFVTANDSNFWTLSNNGAASLAAVGAAAGGTNGLATLTSGSADNGYGNIISVRTGRYMVGNAHLARIGVRVVGLTKTANTRRWGAFTQTGTPPTPVDGYFFELSAADVLSVKAYREGTATLNIASGSFNGAVSQYIMDENHHRYEVMFSSEHVMFMIDDILIHMAMPTTAQFTSNFNLPIAATSVNGVTATSGTLEIWRGSLHRLGREEAAPVWRNIAGANAGTQLKLGPGRLHTLVVNSAGATSTVSFYDATSATNPIAIVTGLTASTPPVAIPYHLDFYTGLFIVTTHASTDITAVFD